jgi:hypothetical protein
VPFPSIPSIDGTEGDHAFSIDYGLKWPCNRRIVDVESGFGGSFDLEGVQFTESAHNVLLWNVFTFELFEESFKLPLVEGVVVGIYCSCGGCT